MSAAPRTANDDARPIVGRVSTPAPIPAAELNYPEHLPVVARREDLLAALRDHQVVVIAGETGSGKSTQLPKICLELGRGHAGRIGHTQPRRIAARTLASRVAQELGRETGGLVGYKVRFHDRVRPETAIKLMTDGILLAELPQDRLLLEYDTLIIDEAHERGLNIDFLLGYLCGLLPQRPDLKVIVTSATIDPQRFATHFADAGGRPAPIIEISGRTHPVEVRYQPPEEENAGERDEEMQVAISAAVDELARAGRGDVLVFLSGEREIRETAETLRKHHPPSTEVLPLYARQSPAEQARIFQPHGTRRVVLATNVAETSLTVPGIHYVIDPGFARLSRYSHRTKVQRLPVERVSQASANQRQGRCGRVAAGICIRLYSEDNFQSRAAFTEPEIQRANLAAVILQMTAAPISRSAPARHSSVLEPDFVVAAELVETSRLWARTNARIEPEWAEDVGRHVVKRTVSEPRWSKKQGAVVASERVTLYGVTLVADRTIQYARVNAQEAREIFIRRALVEGDWAPVHQFWKDNQRTLARVTELEERARRRDLTVHDDVIFEFFDARIPADVVSERHFDRWWRGERKRRPRPARLHRGHAAQRHRPGGLGRRLSQGLAAGGAVPAGDLPVLAGRSRRRGDGAHPRGRPQPGGGHRLRLAGARPA
jgi:HrpA-like RNA helicase